MVANYENSYRLAVNNAIQDREREASNKNTPKLSSERSVPQRSVPYLVYCVVHRCTAFGTEAEMLTVIELNGTIEICCR